MKEADRDLDCAGVHRAMAAMGCPWPEPTFVRSTGSTNVDASTLADAGASDGTCIVAGEQTAGRGRHGRRWSSDQDAGLWTSTVIRDHDAPTHLPLLAALAVLDVARGVGGLELGIKWPNDVLDERGRKVAGILVEAGAQVAVVGIGINLDRPPREFPDAGAWATLAGVKPDRGAVLAGLLAALYSRVRQDWPTALDEYRNACRTIGHEVRIVLPDGEEFQALATGVTSDGHLCVDTGSTSRIIVAGDVLHATITP